MKTVTTKVTARSGWNDAVVGLLFSEDRRTVALIRKLNSTVGHNGLLNGVGGKCEAFEPPYVTMRREFFEETGVRIDTWEQFAQVESVHYGWRVFFFKAFDDKVNDVVSTTKEQVLKVKVAELAKHETTPDLRWLLPLALAKNQVFVMAVNQEGR